MTIGQQSTKQEEKKHPTTYSLQVNKFRPYFLTFQESFTARCYFYKSVFIASPSLSIIQQRGSVQISNALWYL